MSEITVYTLERCPFCIKLKSILNQKKIEFNEIEIIQDKEGANGAVKKDGRIPVPQVDVKGRVFYDYSTEEALVEEIQKLVS